MTDLIFDTRDGELTDADLAAVSGGIHIMPKSPPFQSPHPPQSSEPVPPPGGYAP
jgi:hypothetical protein